MLHTRALATCATPAVGVPEHVDITVIVCVETQPVEKAVQVIIAEPGPVPVTTPDPEILAAKGLLLVHEPEMALVSVIVEDTHIVDGPEIVGGGSTLNTTADAQPASV